MKKGSKGRKNNIRTAEKTKIIATTKYVHMQQQKTTRQHVLKNKMKMKKIRKIKSEH